MIKENNMTLSVAANMENCFICGISQLPSKSTAKVKNTGLVNDEVTLLEKQVEIFFLVTKLMEIPLEVYTDFFSANGNPSNWLSYCKKCSLLIKQYRKTYDKLIMFQKAFDLLKKQLKIVIKEAYNNHPSFADDFSTETTDVKCVSQRILTFYLNNDRMPEFKENTPSEIEDDNGRDEISIDLIKEETEECLSSEDNSYDNFDCVIDQTMSSTTKSADDTCDLNTNTDFVDDSPTEDSRFRCEYCEQDFKYKVTMRTHIRRFHTKEPKHACEKCGEWFPDRKDVLLHFAKAHPNDVPTKRKRRGAQTPLDGYKCEYCGQDFKHKMSMLVHIRRFHTKEPKVSCEKCGKWFPHRRDVLLHFAKAHPDDVPTKKKIRNIQTRTEDLQFRCKDCGQDFKHKTTMLIHIRRFHTKEPKQACEKCGEWFPDRRDVLLHFAKAHPDDVPTKRIRMSTRTREDDSACRCEYCGQDFKHKTSMNTHIRRFHTKVPIYPCEKCGERFPDRKDVLEHFAKAHPDDVPTKRKRMINRKRNDNSNCKCEYCGQRFKQRNSMIIHIRRFHTKEPKHACEKCGEWFPDRRDVLDHFAKAHPNDVPTKRKRVMPQPIKDDQMPEFKENTPAEIEDDNGRDEISIDLIKEETEECLSSEDNSCDNFDCDIDQTIETPPQNSTAKSTNDTCDLDTDTNTVDDIPKDDSPFRCKYCRQDFKYKVTMRTHIRRFHTKEPKHACEKCGEWFPDRRDVLEHFAKAHPNDVPTKRKRKFAQTPLDGYKCEYCGQYFKHKMSMLIHIRRFHTKEPKVACEKCGKWFPHRRDVLLHFAKAHPDDVPTKSRNTQTRTDNSSFKCEYCGKDFKHKSTMQMHVRRFHIKKPTKACEKCGEWFPSRTDVLIHFAKAHPDDVPIKRIRKCAATRKALEIIICETCGLNCKGSWAFKAHMKIHAGDKPNLCEVCSSRFSNVTELAWHRQAIHYKELNLEPFQCKECGKCLGSPPSLQYHIAAHHGKKNVLCNICGAGFVDKYKLKDHITVRHENQKNFECKECGEKLSRKHQIDAHRQKHSGIFDHVCHVCQKGFVRICSLKRHMKYHSSDYPRKRKSRLRNVNETN